MRLLLKRMRAWARSDGQTLRTTAREWEGRRLGAWHWGDIMPNRPLTHSQRQGRTRLDRRYSAALTPAQRAARALLTDPRWQRARGRCLQDHDYLCAVCLREGRATPATEVHHIKPRATHPELAFEQSNLLPVCSLCHAREETNT